MSKASNVIKVMNELSGSPIGSIKDLKLGANVIYKAGHPLQGMLGIVLNMKADAGTVDLKIGRATRVAVPISDLLSVASPGAGIGSPNKGDAGNTVSGGSGVADTNPSNAGDVGQFGRG